MSNANASNQKPAAPRKTVKQLDDEIGRKFAAVHKKLDQYDEKLTSHTALQLHLNYVDQDLETAERTLKGTVHKIGELQRKSLGITRANAEVAALKLRLAKLENTIKNSSDPAVTSNANNGIDRVEKRLVELFGVLQADIADQQVTLDEHTATLAEHNERLANHDDRIGELREDVTATRIEVHAARTEFDMASEGLNSLHSRVSTVETKTNHKFPILGFVIASLAGLIAGIWWKATKFQSTVTLSDGKTTANIPYDLANSGWAALLIGLSVFGFVMVAFLLFPSKGTSEIRESSTTDKTTFVDRAKQHLPQRRTPETSSVPPVPTPSETERVTEDASTKVLATSTGASTGARS